MPESLQEMMVKPGEIDEIISPVDPLPEPIELNAYLFNAFVHDATGLGAMPDGSQLHYYTMTDDPAWMQTSQFRQAEVANGANTEFFNFSRTKSRLAEHPANRRGRVGAHSCTSARTFRAQAHRNHSRRLRVRSY